MRINLSGDIEMKKYSTIRRLILPNQRINYFVVTILLFGVISGSIFLMMLSKNDQNTVVLQIQSFFQNISLNKINSGQVFINSSVIYIFFVFMIWILGFSLLGILFNVFLVYLKGFIVGFSISSIFLTYGYKGCLASFIYCLFGQIFHIIAVCIMCIYSIMFSYQLLRVIFNKKNYMRSLLKKYMIIFGMMMILCVVASLLDGYLFVYLLKLIIHIYVP